MAYKGRVAGGPTASVKYALDPFANLCFNASGFDLAPLATASNIAAARPLSALLRLTVDDAVRSSANGFRFVASERSVPEGLRLTFLDDVSSLFRSFDDNLRPGLIDVGGGGDGGGGFTTITPFAKVPAATEGVIELERVKVIVKGRSSRGDTLFSGVVKLIGKGTIVGGPNDGRRFTGAIKIKFKRSERLRLT